MPRYLEFRVSLLDIEPEIWRRFPLPASASFETLHYAIQDTFGWEEDHLCQFRDKAGKAVVARCDYPDPYADRPLAPTAGKLRLADFFSRWGKKARYVYDFGDDWQHAVEFRGVKELPETFKSRLLDGARACPLEDSGGVWGYYACCAAAGAIDPKELGIGDLDLAERREWVGEDWDPEEFDLQSAKKAFDS